jgi:hypothetical protein
MPVVVRFPITAPMPRGMPYPQSLIRLPRDFFMEIAVETAGAILSGPILPLAGQQVRFRQGAGHVVGLLTRLNRAHQAFDKANLSLQYFPPCR